VCSNQGMRGSRERHTWIMSSTWHDHHSGETATTPERICGLNSKAAREAGGRMGGAHADLDAVARAENVVRPERLAQACVALE